MSDVCRKEMNNKKQRKKKKKDKERKRRTPNYTRSRRREFLP